MTTETMSVFADTIYKQKYEDNNEGWSGTAVRVVTNVSDEHFPEYTAELIEAIAQRKFMPGGRYLYAAGKINNQYNNCTLFSVEDSREGWGDLMNRVILALTTGAGVGVCYSKIRENGAKIKGMGGESTGPIALMQMVNESGRHIMQGGSRRAALYASLHWDHPDVWDFIKIKDWSDAIEDMKAKDFSAAAPMDGTNISVILDDDFFEAYHNADFTPADWDTKFTTQMPRKMSAHEWAKEVYSQVVAHMLTTAEPGFQIDVGENAGEHLRNACVSGDTEILTERGYERIDELVGTPTVIWNGFDWSEVTPKVTGYNQPIVRVNFSDGRFIRVTPDHKFVLSTDYEGGQERKEASQLSPGDKLIKSTFPVIDLPEQKSVEWAYTQGFISAEGMDDYNWFSVYGEKQDLIKHLSMHRTREESKYNRTVVYPDFAKLPKSFVPFDWSLSSKLDWLAGLFDGDGCVLKEGGLQLCSVNRQFLSDLQSLLSLVGVQSKVVFGQPKGLRPMPDGHGGLKDYLCQESWRICISSQSVQDLIALGFRTNRLKIGATPNRDASRFVTVVSVVEDGEEEIVYCFNEPKNHTGIFNGVIAGQCTEITSADDNDICNLGSINMSRVETKEEFARLVEISTAFLISGTLSSKVPFHGIAETRTKNRRLGLGLMGIYEWLVKRGYTYDPNDELAEWFDEYAKSTDYAADQADHLGISRPVKTRAIAPTGSIGILAETTTGIEPLFATAYKRRYLKGQVWHYQYVIDATAQRMMDQGIDPFLLESAYDLANDPERRVAFQAWAQKWIDHGISSTLNLPSVDKQSFTHQQFGDMLINYLPKLRGITAYPDGARGGQPLNVVPLSEAFGSDGVEYEEFGNERGCVSGSCGV